MRISNYPTDTLTGEELILATDVNTSTKEYKTVNFSVDTLKTFLTTNNEFTNIELGGSIIFEGATADGFETTLSVTDPTADNTVTIPNATGFVALYDADPLGVTITSTPAELNILDGVTATASELNILDGVTATTAEINYLDITTLGTSENSKVVTADAGGTVKLTGELQVSYASPVILLEDTGTSRADSKLFQNADLFRIDTKASGAGSWITAFDVDCSTSTPKVTIHHGLIMPSGANIVSSADIQSDTLETNTFTLAGTEITSTGAELNVLDGATVAAVELNILDASAGNTAETSDMATSDGAFTSNNYKISHTLTLDGDLADDGELNDIVVTNDKVLSTSVILANSSVACQINIHTVVSGSFKVRVKNISGGVLSNDSTMVINYRVI